MEHDPDHPDRGRTGDGHSPDATGAALQTTNFHVPTSLPAGDVEITVIANGIPSNPVHATSVGVHFPRVFEAEAWLWLIGSLADGPLWAWGPNGPVPVDPWGPDVVKQTAAARQLMLDGMKQLQQIGAKVVQQRGQAAASVPPAVDLEATGKASDADRT
jgi:hypothetical protein